MHGHKYKFGDKVRFTSKELHSIEPRHYPPVGTLGEIIDIDPNYDGLYVRWSKGTTSIDDCWWCDKYFVEPVGNE